MTTAEIDPAQPASPHRPAATLHMSASAPTLDRPPRPPQAAPSGPLTPAHERRPSPASRTERGLARTDSALRRLPAWRVPSALEPSHPRSPVWTWVLTRAWVLLAVGLGQSDVIGDVRYYGRSLYGLFRNSTPLRETLQEYPLPVFGVLLPPFFAGGLNPFAFGLLFVVSMLSVDALFTRFLIRRQRQERSGAPSGCRGAVAFWIWFVALTGPLAYFRFDLVPAVLAGAAIVAAFTQPVRAGLFTTLGTSLKLWPAALLPTMLVHRGNRRRVAAGFAGSGLVVLGVCSLIGGWARLVSPLQWQSDRGLQIESIFALPLMIGRAVHQDGVWDLRVSQYKAWEVFGAGSDLLTAASSVATGLTAVWLIWLWVRAFRLPDVSMRDVGWMVLATVAVMTVVNKTLSPQYLIWLAGPLAVLLLQPARDAALRRVTVLMLVVAGLTQLIYPLTYDWLVSDNAWQIPLATVLLLVRNLLIVWVTVIAVRTAWRLTAPRHPTDSTDSGELPATDAESTEPSQSLSSTA